MGTHGWLIALFAAGLGLLPPPALAQAPRGEARAGYVDEGQCAGCHPRQFRAWQASKHRRAMQPATPASVLGDFRQPPPAGLPSPIRLTAVDGSYSLATAGPDGRKTEFPVTHVLGVHPLQQLLVSLPGGRLQAFTLAWDTVRHRWFDLQREESTHPGESLHWSGRYQNWNLMCGECHTTAFRKGYDEAADTYRTTWAVGHVGCQACHGPGEAHVGQRQAGRMASYDAPRNSFSQVDRCAACHARRTRLIENVDPDGAFLDNFQPDTLRPDLYHPDGQQLAEVFEYGSFRQSRMYAAGVACTDCHDAHGGKLHAEGNALCTRCHNPAPNPRYPGLRAKAYDSPQHHFHPAGSPGSRCVDCHMPSRDYMVVHARRDHAIRVPRPDLSARLNTPNACTGCHAGRDAAWATAELAKRFGSRSSEPHYGAVLAMGWQGRNLEAVAALARDPEQPGIVRATAVELLGRLSPQRIPLATLKDADPVVRSVAAQGLANHAPRSRLAQLAPLLKDPVRAVRIAAARSLADLPDAVLPRDAAAARAQGLAEYRAAQGAMADMPSAQLNLALLSDELQQPERAAEHFRRAVAQDPALLAARLAFAQWLIAQGNYPEAEHQLDAAQQIAPENVVVQKMRENWQRAHTTGVETKAE